MGSVYLGVLKGYSDKDTEDYGVFNMYLDYSSISRSDSGNSETVTIYGYYIRAVPKYEKKRYTTNWIYIDSVSIGSVSLGISDSWKGCEPWYKLADNTWEQKPKAYKGTAISSKSLSFSRTTNSATVTLYGHRTGQDANKQKLTQEIDIPAGWANLSEAPSVTIKDNGDNTATISGKVAKYGSNNKIKTSIVYYTTNGADIDGAQTYTKSESVTTDSQGSYEFDIDLDTFDAQVVKASAWCIGDKGDSITSYTQTGTAYYYTAPGAPIDLTISNDNNDIEITAKSGSDGSNNDATGIEIYYTTDGTDPTTSSTRSKYTGVFTISQSATIKAAARTVGTYTGNSNAYYYSMYVQASSDETAYSNPGIPDALTINDNGNNSYCFDVKVGKNGTNNTATGVEIYYSIYSHEPSDSEYPTYTSYQKKILISGSQYQQVQSHKIEFNLSDYPNSEFYVCATARTVGSVSNEAWLYSSASVYPETQKILCYKKPVISQPIIAYDKKLTKKSIITVHQETLLYKNSKIEDCKVYLYKDADENSLSDDQPIIPSDVNTLLEEQDMTLNIEHQFDLSQWGIKPKDNIYVKILYAVKNAAQDNLSPDYEQIPSQMHLVESSGIMRVKQGEHWYEGQVWVKVSGEWKEATDVFVNSNGAWKESV